MLPTILRSHDAQRDEHVVSVMLTITEQSDGPGRIADDSFNWSAGRHSDDGGCRRLVGEVCFDCVTSNEQCASSNRKNKDCATQLLLMRRPDISRIETSQAKVMAKAANTATITATLMATSVGIILHFTFILKV
jgi:hypothetical protein